MVVSMGKPNQYRMGVWGPEKLQRVPPLKYQVMIRVERIESLARKPCERPLSFGPAPPIDTCFVGIWRFGGSAGRISVRGHCPERPKAHSWEIGGHPNIRI